jgi:hypothetical protein
MFLNKNKKEIRVKNSLDIMRVVRVMFLLLSLITYVPVAQWIARWTSNPKVVGSIPTRDAFQTLFFSFFSLQNLKNN